MLSRIVSTSEDSTNTVWTLFEYRNY